MSKPQQQEAIEALLERSRRSFVPLPRGFAQARTEAKGAGPLASFAKRQVALDLYLLVHALASQAPWDVTLPARVWARLLGLDEQSPSSASLISRQWSWLESERLLQTERMGRHRRLVLLREDGSGEPYWHPGLGRDGAPPEGDYLRFPHVYWTGGFYRRLDLAGKTVLLIALSLQDDFILPVEHAPAGMAWGPIGCTAGCARCALWGCWRYAPFDGRRHSPSGASPSNAATRCARRSGGPTRKPWCERHGPLPNWAGGSADLGLPRLGPASLTSLPATNDGAHKR